MTNCDLDKTYLDEVRKRLCLDFGGKENSTHIQDIKCLGCDRSSAYCSASDPRAIWCNHKNSCGHKSSHADYFPGLQKDYYSKVPVADPLARARTYATVERGIVDFEKWGGKPVYKKIQGEFVHALEFELYNPGGKTSYNFRLINHPCKDKTNCNWGESSASMWLPDVELNYGEPIVIAESPLKAMALLEAGIQAVSVVSSGCRPEKKKWLAEKLKDCVFLTLAFDNDSAGEIATRAWAKYLDETGLGYDIAFPDPDVGDWDDMLKAGVLDKESFDKCKTYGKIFTAESAEEAAKIMQESFGFCPRVFEWHGSTYTVKHDKKDPDIIDSVRSILGGQLKGSHIFYDHDHRGETVYDYFLTYKSIVGGLKPQTFSVSGAEISSDRCFDALLATKIATNFRGDRADLHALNQNVVKIETLKRIYRYNRYGYHPKTEAFVFANFAVDKAGKVHSLNKQGYFEALNLAPMSLNKDRSNHVAQFTRTDPRTIIRHLNDAWGERALLPLGYYISTLFSHITFKEYGYHPHLSLYKTKNRGKSMLIKFLNTMICLEEWEGVALSPKSTPKSIVRIMSRKHSLPVVFLEGNKAERLPIQENDLLALYNRAPTQTRANFTNDNSTNEVEYDAGLVMVQNFEWFTIGAVKERFVSIDFDERGGVFTKREKQAYQALRDLKGPGLASFGLYVLENRRHFEDKLLEHIQYASNALRKETGIENERVLGNHSIVLGGLSCLLDLVHGQEKPYLDDCLKFLAQRSKDKIGGSVNSSDNLSHFFEAFKQMSHKEKKLWFVDFGRGSALHFRRQSSSHQADGGHKDNGGLRISSHRC